MGTFGGSGVAASGVGVLVSSGLGFFAGSGEGVFAGSGVGTTSDGNSTSLSDDSPVVSEGTPPGEVESLTVISGLSVFGGSSSVDSFVASFSVSTFAGSSFSDSFVSSSTRVSISFCKASNFASSSSMSNPNPPIPASTVSTASTVGRLSASVSGNAAGCSSTTTFSSGVSYNKKTRKNHQTLWYLVHVSHFLSLLLFNFLNHFRLGSFFRWFAV